MFVIRIKGRKEDSNLCTTKLDSNTYHVYLTDDIKYEHIMITFLVVVSRVECHFSILKSGFNVDLRRHTNESKGSTDTGVRVGWSSTHMESEL